MKQFLLKAIFVASALLLPHFTQSAHAGDGATILMKNGARVFARQGFKTLSEEIKKFNREKSEHRLAEVNLDGSTVYIALADIALLCRDKCDMLKITLPKSSKN